MWRRLFSLQCPSCGRPCSHRCDGCWATFPPPPDAPPPAGVDALWSAFAYDGRVRNLVLAAKATPSHGWLETMADALAGFDSQLDRPDRPERPVVAWPTGSAEHRRRRGYDPAERLARRYARRHGLVAVDVLERVGGAQEGRTAGERSSLRFVAKRPIEGRSVLVIDDVVTTGASMGAAAAALHLAGASSVVGLAFARRP